MTSSKPYGMLLVMLVSSGARQKQCEDLREKKSYV